MRYAVLLFVLAYHQALAQIPYFNVQFDYNNQWESSGRSTLETDSFFLIPTFTGTPWVNVWDTAFVVKIKKSNLEISVDKIDFFEGSKAVNLISTNKGVLLQGIHFKGHDYINETDFFLCRYMENGLDSNTLHRYGLPNRGEYLYRPIQTSDGGIFTSGWSPSTITNTQPLLLFKCDSNLNQQYLKLYPPNPSGHHFGLGSIETTDKGVIIVGNRRVNVYRDNAIYFKVDSLGNVLWWKELPHNGDTTNVYFTDIVKKGDGTYLVVGNRRFDPQVGPSHGTFWVVNIDSDGKVLWWKEHDPNYHSYWQTITPSLDGNYYACGVATVYDLDFPTGFAQYGVISKLSPEGNLIWHRKYTVSQPNKQYDIFFNVLATSDGGILCNGTTYENDTTRQNAWIVKLDGKGCLAPGPGCSTTNTDEPIELPVGKNSWVTISPNPTTGQVSIRAKEGHHIEAWRIFDPSGRLVQERLGLNETQSETGLGSGPAGVYVVSVLVDGVWNVRQVVKMP